jgi:hypothetical protein
MFSLPLPYVIELITLALCIAAIVDQEWLR